MDIKLKELLRRTDKQTGGCWSRGGLGEEGEAEEEEKRRSEAETNDERAFRSLKKKQAWAGLGSGGQARGWTARAGRTGKK